MILSINRLYIVCLASLFQALILSAIYYLCLRSVVESVAAKFLPYHECLAGETVACEQAISGFSSVQFYGYAIFRIVTFFAVAFITTAIVVGKQSVNLKRALPFVSVAILGPYFIIWVAALSSIENVAINAFVMIFGISSALVWRSFAVRA